MEKNELSVPAFFGQQGLTAASANHIADIAKESYQAVEKRLSSMDFHKTTVVLIGSSDETVISYGMSAEQFAGIRDGINEIVELKRLIAYLREAIKAKEKLAEEAGEIGSSELEQLLDSKPEKEPDLIAQDVIDSWNIKERNHYLSLQTKCAVIGKFIHPDGALSEARKAYMERLSTPKAVKENGKDTLVYTYYPNVEGEEVESMFFALQAEHRSAQAELNGMMHEIEKTIAADKEEKSRRWSAALEQWKADVDLKREDLNRERNRKRKEVEALKIVIPDNLRPIYEKLRQF